MMTSYKQKINTKGCFMNILGYFKPGIIARLSVSVILLAFLPAAHAVSSSAVPSLQKMIDSKEPVLGVGNKVYKLRIEDCIKNALKYNYDIQIARYNPAISIDDITSAEAYFDTTVFASGQIDHKDENNIDATYYGAYYDDNGNTVSEKIIEDGYNRYHNHSYSVGLSKMLSTGATFQISESVSRINDLQESSADLYYEPFIENTLTLQLQQPLLRDFGVDVNRASIRAAHTRLGISKQEFQMQVINTMLEVERNYWVLFYYRQHVKIRQQLLERAEQTLQRVMARSDYDGKSSSIARTQSVIEEARADMLSAQNSALSQQETLLESINNPEWPISSRCEIITLDNPQQRQYDVSFEQAVETALELRPELVSQKLGIEISHLALDLAKNQVLPRADLYLSHSISGAGVNDDMALNRQLDNDTYDWSVGISMEYPLANRAAKAALSQTTKKLEQEELRLKSLQEQVMYDVSISLHELHHKFSEIKARMDSVTAARNELLTYLAIQDTERRDSNSPEFLNLKLNADDRLSRNQITAVQAMIEYDLAVMNIHRAQGCLDKYNNVVIKIDE